VIEVGAHVLVADRYRLDTPIGRGGMGEVWRATDEVLGRPVAVKLLLGSEVDASATARFRLEAQTAARLSHPHLVAVFDFGAWQDRFYLVMEFVEGASLAQVLASEEALSPERVAHIAAQAAAGLAAAHRQGVVHRDIKPGNLMLDAQGTVKIGDFGIARFVDDPSAALTTAGQIVGTSLYLAPERALGRAAGPASDMYSLGCVLYQLLVGRPPFRSDTATGTLYQHVDAVPVPPRQLGVGVSPAFEAYLLGLLAKQPEDRPPAEQVADWFRTDAWRGRPEPMPEPAPMPNPAPTMPHPGPRPHPRPMPNPAHAHEAETGGATVYRLPTTTTAAAARPDSGRRAKPAQRTSARALVRRRPRVASAIGGVIAFLVAVLIGMAWFSPDTGTANTPGTGTTAPPHTDSESTDSESTDSESTDSESTDSEND
jgi:serine/threonine protein kinase